MGEIKVLPDGTAVFDSVEDVLRYQTLKAGQSGTTAQVKPPDHIAADESRKAQGASVNGNTDPHQSWAQLMDLLGEKQRATLRAIKTRSDLTLDELRSELDAETVNSVSGFLTSIQRQAKKANIDLKSLYRRIAKGTGRSRVIRYQAGPLLRAREVPES